MDSRAGSTLQKVGRFDLLDKLGSGTFGTVWRARDRDLDRDVAVKIPRRLEVDNDPVDVVAAAALAELGMLSEDAIVDRQQVAESFPAYLWRERRSIARHAGRHLDPDSGRP